MNLKAFLFKIVLPLIVMCLAVVAAFAFYWDRSWGRDSSFGLDISTDGQLIAIFQDHRAAFEKLQQMAAEDAALGWYLGTSETNKISGSRRQEYKRLMSEVRPGLIIGMDYGTMRFIFAGDGTAISPGWAKGIEYVPGSNETNGAIYGLLEEEGTNYQHWKGLLLTNLDSAQTLPANVYMRPIESNWFIFYQRSD
jgi:hypothetical protein